MDGQLHTMSREECFSLGVEWGMAWQLAKGSAAFAVTVHGENKDRIVAMLETQQRKVSIEETGDWATVTVAGLD